MIKSPGNGSVGPGGITGLANPTASIGLVAVNGVATTALRSDAAQALDQTIAPTMSGVWTFSNQATLTKAGASSADPSLLLSSARPVVHFVETDQAVDTRIWVQQVTGSDFRVDLLNDAGSVSKAAVRMTRTAAALTAINIGNATDNNTFSFLGTGNVQFGGTTTGAQTATFVATNKPGSGTAGPIAWVPVLTTGGTQGYVPVFGA